MECNKEDAVRARCMAEKKMQCRDFVGARKFALKAQQLSSDLENISQMLAVCEVHCSAETKVNGFEDLYGILQVESTADESLIKKQYRKLALLLHPDKNKFAGAEAAFKLVGEAHRTLSDQAQRSVYDMRRKPTIPTVGRRPPPHQPNMSSNARKQPSPPAPNNYRSNGTTPLTQQKTQTADAAQTFWTACPYCRTKYQYYHTIMNRALRCQNCMSPFIAYDVNAQSAPPIFKSEHSFKQAGMHQYKDSQAQGTTNTSQQGNSTSYPFKERPTMPQPNTRMGAKNMFGEEFDKVRVNSQMENGLGKEHEIKAEKVKFETVSKREPKRSRKMVVESSDTESTDSEEMTIEESDPAESSHTDGTDSEEVVNVESGHAGAQNVETTGSAARRSARQKHNVSYNEDSTSDDDFEKLSKSGKLRRKSHGDDQSKKELSDEEADEVEVLANATAASKSNLDGRKRGRMPAEEEKPNGNKLRKKCMEESGSLKVKDGAKESPKDGVKKDEREESSDGVSSMSDSSANKVDSDTLSYPDPEFHDFDQYRDQSCFAVDQIWALYDDLDGMPRFYARIRGVSSTSFKLRFTWLEYVPVGQGDKEWSNEGLPVACGNFIHGKTENTEEVQSFSHVVLANKDSKINSYGIYPRKGEVWALYKGWNIKWRSNADQHREYEYEFVEVLSDFALGADVNVTPLAKVKGFVSLFCQGGKRGVCILHIPPNELLRFSHMVPSYRMTGEEKEGIPKGFYELDPASLPSKFFEETFDSVSLDEVMMWAKKSGKSGDVFAEGLNGTCEKKHGQASGSHFTGTQAERNINGTGPSEHQDSYLDKSTKCYNNVIENGYASMSEPVRSVILENSDSEFYDFHSERTAGKFRAGQIWALYCEEDGFPKYYGLVKKVDSECFKVRITWLEPCALGEEELKWSANELPFACGRFGRRSGKEAYEDYDTADTFSHLVQAKAVEKKQYDIYPLVNEVWAVFKNWDAGWKISDLKRCSEKGEYEVVEILSSSASTLTVVILEKVDGFEAVFRPRRNNEVPSQIEIPKHEFLRFSHRIPSFRLTAEGGGSLRDYWELDAASLPDVLLRTNSD